MRSVAIDPNGYTAFKRGDPAVVGVLRHAPEIFVGTTVLGELLAGFAAGSRENANRVELTRLLESPRVKQVCEVGQAQSVGVRALTPTYGSWAGHLGFTT